MTDGVDFTVVGLGIKNKKVNFVRNEESRKSMGCKRYKMNRTGNRCGDFIFQVVPSPKQTKWVNEIGIVDLVTNRV